MHYGEELILAAAEDIGNGWKKIEVVLEEGDTATCGASTKYDWKGPGSVTYHIHPSGWTEIPVGVVRRRVVDMTPPA